MRTYARIVGGVVVEIILPSTYGIDVYAAGVDGHPTAEIVHRAADEVQIADRFVESFVATLVDVTDVSPVPEQGYTYDGANFAPYVPPSRTSAEIAATNTATRNQLLAAATMAIAPLQDAVDLDESTAQEAALLKQWKQFRVAVNRVELTQEAPEWPVAPQPNYGSVAQSQDAAG